MDRIKVVATSILFASMIFVTPVPAHAGQVNVKIIAGNHHCKAGGGYVSSNIMTVDSGYKPNHGWVSGSSVTRNVLYRGSGSVHVFAGTLHCKKWILDPGRHVTFRAERYVDKNTVNVFV